MAFAPVRPASSHISVRRSAIPSTLPLGRGGTEPNRVACGDILRLSCPARPPPDQRCAIYIACNVIKLTIFDSHPEIGAVLAVNSAMSLY